MCFSTACQDAVVKLLGLRQPPERSAIGLALVMVSLAVMPAASGESARQFDVCLPSCTPATMHHPPQWWA
jgi:hypothetical protein